jgi:hypothetical protein
MSITTNIIMICIDIQRGPSISRLELSNYQRIVDHIHVHGQLDTMHTHTMHTHPSDVSECRWIPGANWPSYDHSLRSCRWRNMFYHGAAIHHLLFQIRLESVTSRAFPIVAARVNPTLKPVFRSAESGEAERLRERQWNGKTRLKSSNTE